MKQVSLGCLGVLALIVFFLGIAWIATGNEFFIYQYFAPKRAEVERKVFENTKSYRQGMIQELQNMQMEYIKGTDSQKTSMRSIILHRASDFPLDEMPMDLRNFIVTLRTQTQKSY